MKKFLLTIGLTLVCSMAYADSISIIDQLKKIPGIRQGVAWSIEDSKLNYLSTVEVMSFKGFSLDVGAAYDAENTGVKAVGLISYDLLNLEKLGVTVPILKYIDIRPGIYAGYGRIEGFQDSQLKGEGDCGVSVSIVSVKF